MSDFDAGVLPDANKNVVFSATGTGTWVRLEGQNNVFQAELGLGGTSATVEIHLSLTNTCTPGAGTKKLTLVLSGSKDPANEAVVGPYLYGCAKVTQLTGDVKVTMNGID